MSDMEREYTAEDEATPMLDALEDAARDAKRIREAHTSENDMPTLIDRIAEVLNVHRWKSMGVRSVECECGKVISQGAGTPTLTEFPADEAFRRHIAAEATRVLPPGSTAGASESEASADE